MSSPTTRSQTFPAEVEAEITRMAKENLRSKQGETIVLLKEAIDARNANAS